MSSERPAESSNPSQSLREEYLQATPVGSFKAYEHGTIEIKDIFAIVRRRALLIAAVTGIVFAASVAWTLTRKPIYATGFELLITSPQPNPVLRAAIPGDANAVPGVFGAGDHTTLVGVLKSPTVLGPAIAALQSAYPGINATQVSRGLSIIQRQNADILQIAYTDTDPARAFAISNQLSKSFIRFGDTLRNASLTQGISFVEKQLPLLQARVNQLSAQEEQFRQRYGILDPNTRGASLASYISGIDQQQKETRSSLDEARETYANLRRQLGNYSPTEAIAISSLNSSPRYQTLLTKLQETETQIASASVTLQPNNPQMLVLQETRSSLLPLLKEEAKKLLGNKPLPTNRGNIAGITVELNTKLVTTANDIQMLEARNRALNAAEGRVRKDFKLYPALTRQYTELQRQLKIATESLERFLATQEKLEIEAAQKSNLWQIMSEPFLPNSPISPNIPRNLSLGFIGALLLGAGAAFLAEKLQDVFHSTSDLKRDVLLPILGVIPFRPDLKNAKSRRHRRGAAGNDLVAQAESILAGPILGSPRFIESFRSLFSNLRLLSPGTPLRSIVISSALPSDGKSTVAFNLAVAAAAMGQRILIVDTDLRRPTVHLYSRIPNLIGVSNILTGDISFQEVVQQSSLEENLYILTAGQIPPDPTRLLSSVKMQQMMKDLEANFDLVIYDSPPLVGFADSLMLSSNTDGCLIVVGLGQTPRAALVESLDYLKLAGTSVLGLVANCMKQHAVEQTYSYNQQYYQRYYAGRPAAPDPKPPA
jgi:polysaccharide biosynthesis transport protein